MSYCLTQILTVRDLVDIVTRNKVSCWYGMNATLCVLENRQEFALIGKVNMLHRFCICLKIEFRLSKLIRNMSYCIMLLFIMKILINQIESAIFCFFFFFFFFFFCLFCISTGSLFRTVGIWCVFKIAEAKTF